MAIKDAGNHFGYPVTSLKGVGPVAAKGMEKKGIVTVEDLLYYVPIRWLDRGSIREIGELSPGEEANIVARVDSYRSMFFRNARKKGFEVIVGDGTGLLSLKWFRWTKGYLQNICRKDLALFLSGRVGSFNGTLQIVHPEVTVLADDEVPNEAGRVIPLYSQIEGVKQGTLRRIISEALAGNDPLPCSLLPEAAERALTDIPFIDALRNIHRPKAGSFTGELGEKSIKRLILEEYLHFQTALFIRKKDMEREEGISFKTGGPLRERFLEGLGFELTAAQKRVIDEIEEDMGRKTSMNRLLQGDVGSGKTVCAVAACCDAVDNGYQAAFMAPTEILAEQHYLNVHRWFSGLGVPVVLLKGNMGRERRDVLEKIRTGASPVVIGTHAVIQKDVEFERLGLVIIDEQHRFGVQQRKRLKEKSESPDILSMTATPIPRTLSMVLYGDLDVSVINEMPRGRQKIRTKVLADDEKEKAYAVVREELVAGRGAFIVYPLVEESEKMELKAASAMASHLQKDVFPDKSVGLLHGRMRTQDKEDVMGRFRQGKIDVLVCTTVIEVGIDVPHATVIVIENAERFGLSQLHQLRGRVGRGTDASKCILVASTRRTEPATKRLRIMEKTDDGFVIAEEDLRLRGAGDMLGVRQSGLPRFRIGDIIEDIDIMVRARTIAEGFVKDLADDEVKKLRRRIGDRFDDKMGLSDIA